MTTVEPIAPALVAQSPGQGKRGQGARLPRSARRAQLLRAAQEIFVAQGYHAAAMDDIAERAGVSKPVLYQHFPSKLELYLALLEHHVEALVVAVQDAMASTTDNKARVRGAITAYLDFVDGEGEAYRLVFETDLRNDPAVRERVESMTARCVDAIASTIAADTQLPGDEARLLSVGLAGLAEVGARWWLLDGGDHGPVARERAVDLLVGLAWRGIAGYPGPATARG